MRVNIEFDRPFYGMIFSKGFYSDPHCVHLKPGTGHLSATFEIFLNSCGMSSSANHNVAAYGAPTPSGSYVENTIIVQYDPYVQEVWDQARKLRCTWYDFYEKAVTFRPFQVDMLHAVTANFLGDNLQCWMQIQVGKGPWASEVSGIVKIGQTMTMVLAIKDDENKFDMLVRNCVAHDGKRAPIQLVDQYGCVVRPKIMSRWVLTLWWYLMLRWRLLICFLWREYQIIFLFAGSKRLRTSVRARRSLASPTSRPSSSPTAWTSTSSAWFKSAGIIVPSPSVDILVSSMAHLPALRTNMAHRSRKVFLRSTVPRLCPNMVYRRLILIRDIPADQPERTGEKANER